MTTCSRSLTCICWGAKEHKGSHSVPHRGQMAHGHIKGLNRVEGDLQSAADQSFLQQAPWHLGQPTDWHLKYSVLSLTWNGYLKVHLEYQRKESLAISEETHDLLNSSSSSFACYTILYFDESTRTISSSFMLNQAYLDYIPTWCTSIITKCTVHNASLFFSVPFRGFVLTTNSSYKHMCSASNSFLPGETVRRALHLHRVNDISYRSGLWCH